MVWLAAAAAFLARFPGLLWPLRPDEAGFLMVARAWHPEAGSLYGHYFVDRPPPVIWLMQATDAIGGPYAHRVVGALACSVLVLASAAAAREMARRAGVVDPAAVRRLAGWVAVATAAMVGNAQIDPVAAKGELFGIPLVMGSCWLALRAVRRVSAGDAFWAGLLAMLAVGFKQSIVGGLVFGAVLLVGSALARHLSWRDALRCAGAAVAGAAVPVALVVAWALGVGVRLQTLWYTSVSFRSDANRVIASQDAEGAADRIWVLLVVFVGVGMLLVLACFVARLPGLLRHDAVPIVAIMAMVGTDLVGVAVSGSYWLPYLFVLVPGLSIALAALLAHDHLRLSRRRVSTAAVAFVVASSVISLVALDRRLGARPGPRGGADRGGDRGRRPARRPGPGLRRARRHPVGQPGRLALPLPLVAADAHPRPRPERPARRAHRQQPADVVRRGVVRQHLERARHPAHRELTDPEVRVRAHGLRPLPHLPPQHGRADRRRRRLPLAVADHLGPLMQESSQRQCNLGRSLTPFGPDMEQNNA